MSEKIYKGPLSREKLAKLKQKENVLAQLKFGNIEERKSQSSTSANLPCNMTRVNAWFTVDRMGTGYILNDGT
jgi:hypothetical protein